MIAQRGGPASQRLAYTVTVTQLRLHGYGYTVTDTDSTVVSIQSLRPHSGVALGHSGHTESRCHGADHPECFSHSASRVHGGQHLIVTKSAVLTQMPRARSALAPRP